MPFDLGLFNAPGCFIGNSIDATAVGVTTPGNDGTATITVPIPSTPFLQGGVFFSQFLFVEAAANPLGIFTSNSRLDTIGRFPHVARIYAIGNLTATAVRQPRRDQQGISSSFGDSESWAPRTLAGRTLSN